MVATYSTGAQKVRVGAKQGISKLEKLSKMDSERAAFKHYKTKLNDIWYELALDEALCLTIYAIGYDTDKTARLTHLRRARRSLKNIIPTLEKEKAEKAVKLDENANKLAKEANEKAENAIKTMEYNSHIEYVNETFVNTRLCSVD